LSSHPDAANTTESASPRFRMSLVDGRIMDLP
jgi:hypothetical protein